MENSIINETVVKDIVNIINDVKDAGTTLDIDKIKKNNYVSIAKKTSGLVLVFPVITSKSVDIHTASMAAKAQERQAVSMLQLLFSAVNLTTAKDGFEFIQNFHKNINFGRMSMDDFIDVMDKVSSLAEDAVISPKQYDILKEDIRNLNCYFEEDFSEYGINSFKILDTGYSKEIIQEDKKNNKDYNIDHYNDRILDPIYRNRIPDPLDYGALDTEKYKEDRIFARDMQSIENELEKRKTEYDKLNLNRDKYDFEKNQSGREFGYRKAKDTKDYAYREKIDKQNYDLNKDKYDFDVDRYNQDFEYREKIDRQNYELNRDKYDFEKKQSGREFGYRKAKDTKDFEYREKIDKQNYDLNKDKYDFDVDRYNKDYAYREKIDRQNYELNRDKYDFDVDRYNKDYAYREKIDKQNYDLNKGKYDFDVDRYNKDYAYREKIDKQNYELNKARHDADVEFKELELQNKQDEFEKEYNLKEKRYKIEKKEQKRKQMRDEYLDRRDQITHQLVDNDVKKSNELVPTLMTVNFNQIIGDKKNNVVKTSILIGVKCKIYAVDSKEMINRIIVKNQDRHGLLKLIKASTREINFLSDFLFAVDRAKLDAKNQSKKNSSNKIFKILERRQNLYKLKRRFGLKNVDVAPISTFHISVEEVELIKKMARIDLYDPAIARSIMESYSLMSFCISDETSESISFLYDTGEDHYETLSFNAVERETTDNSKKIVNLMSKFLK